MEKRCKGPPAYETPAMVTYQAEDLLEEISLTKTGWCSGSGNCLNSKPPGSGTGNSILPSPGG